MYRIAAVMATLVALAVTSGAAWFAYQTPGTLFGDDRPAAREPRPSSGDTVLLTVAAGESAGDIGAALEAEGVIRSGRLFEVLVGLTGVQNSLEAGDYEFERGMATIETVHRIADGRTASNTVTLQEGLRSEEMAEILEENGIVTREAFIAALDPDAYNLPFLADITTPDLQGFLFPARYEFSRDTSAAEVVETLLRGFQDNVADSVQLEGQGLTLTEVVTLAAIVEREAVVAEERPLIAGVYLNRLRTGIPLQADPTTQFAVAQDPASVATYGWWKQELTIDDLRLDSPYNTYVYGGLTPGPIANPGLDSIEAVIRPETTDFLFFVAKGDGTGAHVFAETLEEHLRNVEQYQR